MVFQKVCDEVYGSKNKMESDENNKKFHLLSTSRRGFSSKRKKYLYLHVVRALTIVLAGNNYRGIIHTFILLVWNNFEAIQLGPE